MKTRILSIIVFSLSLFTTALAADENVVRATFITDQGNFVAEIYPDKAPITANNFLKNVKAGFYEQGRFYRVSRISNNPKPTLSGPVLNIIQGGKNANMDAPEPIEHEGTDITGLNHVNGVLSMARGAIGTASTEFSITIGENEGLNTGSDVRYPEGQREGYATFGRVVEGMDVVIKIQQQPSGKDAKDLDDWYGHQTLDQEVVIERVVIE